MSKKKYVLPTTMSAEIGDTIKFVNNNIGSLNYNIVPLNIIELDPENPRDLTIGPDDLPQGPSQSDLLYQKKLAEFESLQELSETIAKYGVRNAIEIYKFGDKYRLIHGERRYLASIIAGKKDILAKILNEKPNDFDIRMLQLIENVQREDLSLRETLNNIRQVVDEYKKHVEPDAELTVTLLMKLINRSKSLCSNIITVLEASSDVQDAINQGKIKSLDKAAIIASCKTEDKRAQLLYSCLNGASLKQLKNDYAQGKKVLEIERRELKIHKKSSAGKPTTKIVLGHTQKPAIVAKLAKLIIDDPHYRDYREIINTLRFDDYRTCAESFKKLLRLMEQVEPNNI